MSLCPFCGEYIETADNHRPWCEMTAPAEEES